MKAVLLTENGGIDKLRYTEDHSIPEIQPNEVLVKLKATSINRADLVIRHGYPGLVLHLPHILGGDIAGEVVKTGEDVNNFKEGDRVVSWSIIACNECEWCRKGRPGLCFKWKYFGMHVPGSYAEFAAVPESSLLSLPDNVTYEDAACMPVAGLTAYHALHGVADIKSGDNFFLWGGSSGLGMIAIQLAKLKGAKVFATAGTDDKMAKMKQAGADYVFDHRNKSHVADEVLKITGNFGADIVMDFVGPEAHPHSFRMVKKGGKILWCGILTGREALVSMHQTYLRHISLLGLYLGEKDELEALIALLSQGKIKPYIGDTLHLKEAGRGHEMLAEGTATGKVVLRID